MRRFTDFTKKWTDEIVHLASGLSELVGDVSAEAQVAVGRIAEQEFKPFARDVRVEWQSLTDDIRADEGWVGKTAQTVRQLTIRAPHEIKKLKSKTPVPAPLSELKHDLQKRAVAFEERYQVVAQRRLGKLLGTARQKHFNDLANDGGELEIAPEHRRINRYLGLSVALLGSSIASAFAPPLLIVTVPLCLYVVGPVYKYAYLEVKTTKRISLNFVEAVLGTGVLLVGAFGVYSFSLVLYFFMKKVSLLTRDDVRTRMVDVFGQHPRTVWALENGIEVEIPFERLQSGSRVLVRAGQTIPVDGMVRSGMASVDQHQLTGESQPVEKAEGDQVYAMTVVLGGKLEVEVVKAGDATLAAEITHILQKTTNYNPVVAQKSIALSENMVLPTLGLGVIAWPIIGAENAMALLSGAPGAHLMLAAPLTLLQFLNVAAHRSILIKDGGALELLAQVDTVVFDKTGTLTIEQPRLSQIHLCAEISEDELLRAAAAAEVHQSHPIARAILDAAAARHLDIPHADTSKYEIGYGIQVAIAGSAIALPSEHGEVVIRVGSRRFMEMHGIEVPERIAELQAQSHAEGFSVVMVAARTRLLGAIELLPSPRPEAKETVKALRERGISIWIISGDQEGPTKKLADELGIEKYFAGVLPQDKARLVKQLQESGKSVCFVGDGINDAIALKQAEVSISLRGATTVATDTAKIVLMDRDLAKLPFLFDLSREMHNSLNRGFALSVVGGMAVMASVLFLNAGLAAALISSRLVLAVVLGNALLQPALGGEDPVLEIASKSDVDKRASESIPAEGKVVEFPQEPDHPQQELAMSA